MITKRYTLIVLASELYRTFPGETVEDDDDSDGTVETVVFNVI